MIKIYIAGKISGECETPELMQKCIKKFDNYGLRFIRWGFSNNLSYTHGFEINKHLIENGGAPYITYLRNDVKTMLECDEVHFLKDWKQSRGARIENKIALFFQMKVVYEQ